MVQLICHLIGDYLLQNDWMAQNKKKKWSNGFAACLIHCVLYIIPFAFICSIIQCFALFLTHFFIDRFYFVRWFMNHAGQKEFSKPPFAPWSIIVVDNTFHLVTNYIIIQTL